MAKSFIALALTASITFAQLKVASSTASACDIKQYFDTDLLSCMNCPASTVPTDDSKFETFPPKCTNALF